MSESYESSGAKLVFDDAGTGTPVIFLHPTPVDGAFWRPVIAGIEGIRAIVPDLRGHGGSELGRMLPVGEFDRVPDAPVLTMRQLAADILSLLDHLKLDQAFFVGCSIGGYVLLELWRRAPERMRGLAFVCSKPQPDTESGLAKRAATIAAVRQDGAAKVLDSMAENLAGATARRNRPQIVAELRAQMTLTMEALVSVQAGLAVRPDSVPTVATINAPVLAVAGSEDASVSPQEMEAFRAAHGGCEWRLLEGAGHAAAYEQPRAVADLIQNWLRHYAG